MDRAKWTSRGLTHCFGLPPGVVGRDANPGPGTARLDEDPLVAPNFVRRPASDAWGLKLLMPTVEWLP